MPSESKFNVARNINDGRRSYPILKKRNMTPPLSNCFALEDAAGPKEGRKEGREGRKQARRLEYVRTNFLRGPTFEHFGN